MIAAKANQPMFRIALSPARSVTRSAIRSKRVSAVRERPQSHATPIASAKNGAVITPNLGGCHSFSIELKAGLNRVEW